MFDLAIPSEISADSKGFELEVKVSNTGETASGDVVQVYLSPLDGGAKAKPVQLQGFARVSLGAGESTVVKMFIHTEQFGYFDDGHWNVDPGRYAVMVGASSADIRQKSEIVIKGNKAEKPLREYYLSKNI